MPFGIAAGVLAGGGAYLAADASKDAASTQGRSADRASGVSQHQFDTLNEQQQPFINSGYGANQLLSRLLGINTTPGQNGGTPQRREFNSANGQLVGDAYLPPGTTTKSVGKGYYQVLYNGARIGTLKPGGANGKYVADGDPLPDSVYDQLNRGQGGATGGQPAGGDGSGSGLQTGFLTQLFGPDQFKANVDPGYQFRLQQGTQGILNGAAARTGALSGAAQKGLIDYNQAAGSQEYGASYDRFQNQQGNIFQRLLSLTGLGQNAAAGVGQQGVATGAQIGANIIGAGNAAAAGQVGAANAYGGAAGDIAGLLLRQQNQPKAP